MKRYRPVPLLLLALLWLAPALVLAEGDSPNRCLVLDIHQIGHARLAALDRTPGLESWIELDEDLLACGSPAALATLETLAPVRHALDEPASRRLLLAHELSHAELERLGLEVLATGGLFAVVEAREGLTAPDHERLQPVPLGSRLVLARQVANQPRRVPRKSSGGTVSALVASIDVDRWFDAVEALAGYNRHTHSSEIHQARKWLRKRFRRLPGVKVRSLPFDVQGSTVANVIATLRGRIRPDDWFIVGAHYDSTSENPLVAAPGAEDNASGCAGVLEMARIFAAHPPEASVLFICYAGEEQGLIGAQVHVAELIVTGDAGKVGAMLNLDMIGFTADAELDCLLQSDPGGEGLMDALGDSAARHTDLRLVTSFMLGGSDHVPYALVGIPAVLSIENDWSQYPHYHRMTDTPDQLTPEMAAEILRMNVGALARFTGNSDVSGCLELEGEPLLGVRVSSKQKGAPSESAISDRNGCFAVDPLGRDTRFRLRFKGDAPAAPEPTVSGCVRLLGEPLAGRRLVFKQTGETNQKGRTDADGCFGFEAVPGVGFNLVLKGPVFPLAE